MWIALLAFGASFLLILTAGILIFYRSSANRRLSQVVVSQGQAAVLDGHGRGIAVRSAHRKTSVSVSADASAQPQGSFQSSKDCWRKRATAKPGT